MAIYPDNKSVPEGFATTELRVRPLRMSDVKADFEAVVDSRDMLRIWDLSEWPEDDFTIADNLLDLQRHQKEHEARESFTFTVMDAADKVCLGCIYIYELLGVMTVLGAQKADLAIVGELDAYVTFWVRSSRIEDGLDQRLLSQLVEWFDREWSFERVAWGTNTADLHQNALFAEAGLIEKWRLPIAESTESYLVYSRP